MPFLFYLFIIIYLGAFILFLGELRCQFEQRKQKMILEIKEKEQILTRQRDALFKEKIDLESKALEVFILYEITKDITKTFHEEEAFDIFKKSLREHVDFKECRLLEVLSEEIKSLEQAKDQFIFTLQEKNRKLGYLVVGPLAQEDEEKVKILCHQFSLGLRRIKLYKEIEKIAITDGITELYTRRYCLERFKEEVERSKMRKIQMSFLMIDVDFFKNFNDTYGHLTGDQILSELGAIIKENIREIDVAGRYGGEEFSIMLPDTDRKGAQFAAERIRQAVEKATIKVYDRMVQATLSIGISVFPEDAQEMEELIDKADSALYMAKKMGRNRVCFFGIYDSSS